MMMTMISRIASKNVLTEIGVADVLSVGRLPGAAGPFGERNTGLKLKLRQGHGNQHQHDCGQ